MFCQKNRNYTHFYRECHLKNELSTDERTEKAQRRTFGPQMTQSQEAGHHSEERVFPGADASQPGGGTPQSWKSDL